jgi:hypothetical protein
MDLNKYKIVRHCEQSESIAKTEIALLRTLWERQGRTQ